jgi:hypothetical protein
MDTSSCFGNNTSSTFVCIHIKKRWIFFCHFATVGGILFSTARKICTYFLTVLSEKTENMCIFFQPVDFFWVSKSPTLNFSCRRCLVSRASLELSSTSFIHIGAHIIQRISKCRTFHKTPR